MKTFASRLTFHRSRLRAGLADFANLCECSLGSAWNWLQGRFEPSRDTQAAVIDRLACVNKRDVKPVTLGRPRKARAAK